jgi:hypothetical protein
MRTRMRARAALVGAGVLVATALAVQPTAVGAVGSTVTVTAGSAPAGTLVPVTLTSTGTTPQFSYKDTTTGVSLTCDSVTLRGSVHVGAGQLGAGIGTIAGGSAQFTDCLAFAGLHFSWTGYGTWSLDASASSSGDIAVAISNVRIHHVSTAGPTCSWDFGSNTGTFVSSGTPTVSPGTIAGSYSNSTHQLVLPPSSPGSMGLWNVHGSGTATYCVSPSLWKQGDRMALSGSFALTADTPAYNPISIT